MPDWAGVYERLRARSEAAGTNFARADIEAIVAFHRDGAAPVWHTFFDEWNARLGRGKFCLGPFEPKPVPQFTPVAIPPQEVIQEVEG